MERLDLSHPQEIYSQISREVKAIVGGLSTPLNDAILEEARTKAVSSLDQVQINLKAQEEELQRNAEWDTFTIAFYGETNAGKSTILETLRIALHEPTKESEREKFRGLQKSLGLDEGRIEALQSAADKAEAQIKGSQERIEALRRQIAEKKKEARFLQKVVWFFRKFPEEKELRALEKQQSNARNEQKKNEEEFARLKGELSKLEAVADGGIVGDGRSDFTRDTNRYNFYCDGRRFALLDVPGIEGKESAVLDQIWQAVQKAHAVFYVTGKAAPPQTGDSSDSRKSGAGILEKIKQHLGAQTEVWTLYNKRIVNPTPLGKKELLSADEQEGLAALDKEMRKHLGKHYKESFPLSAYPAFLAVADHLPPGSEKLRNRQKILEKMDAEKVLEKSLIQRFMDWIIQLADDAPSKIQRANFNKANALLKGVTKEIDALAKQWADQHERVAKETKATQSGLKNASKALRSRLSAVSATLADELKTSARMEIYGRIENDISNERFKDYLEDIVEAKATDLERCFPARVQEAIKAFEVDVSEMLESHKEHLSDLQEMFDNSVSKQDIDPKLEIQLDIGSGIRWGGLITSLTGIGMSIGAILASNPVGWGVAAIVGAALGIIAGLIGAWKSLRSFFSSSYKKDRQRETANDALCDIAGQVEDNLNSSLKKVFPNLDSKIEKIKNSLDAPTRQIETIHKVFETSVQGLQELSNQVDKLISATKGRA